MPDLETVLNSKVAPIWWIVRSQIDPRTLTTSIATALREASGGLPVAHIRTMEEIEAQSLRVIGISEAAKFLLLARLFDRKHCRKL